MKRRVSILVLLLAGVLANVLFAGSSADTYNIKRALESLQVQDYESAAKFLGQEIQESPDNGYAYAYFAALCDMMTGYNGAMFAFAKRALPLLPKKETTLKSAMEAFQAQVYLEAGDTARALEQWERARAYDYGDLKYYGYIGEVYEDMKDFDRLYELGDYMLNKSKKLNKEPLSYIVMVSALNGQKRYDEAIACAEKGLKLNNLEKNQQGVLQMLKTQAVMGQKRYDEALVEAMELSKVSVGRAVNLLEEIADSSSMQPVLDSIEAAYMREPGQMLWPFAESDIYARHNNYIQAVYQLLRGAKTGDSAEALRTAGQYVVHFMGDPELAEQLFHQAQEKDPNNAMVWGNLADLYHDIGRYDDALDALDQVLRLDPEQKDMNIAYTIRGRVYMSMHNYPRAIEEYSRALVSEHDLDSWPRMAELYRVAGDSASAARTIQQGLMEMQKDTTVDMLLAMGDTARAKAKVPQMVRKQNSASQHYNAACMYSRMHMPDDALAALRKSLENGFRNFYHFAWDQDLDNIRDLPEFKAMMDEYKAKVKEEQAELKRLMETL